MDNDVRITRRDRQFYIAYERWVHMAQIPIELPPLIDKVIEHAAAVPAGAVEPVFFRYLEMDSESRMLVHVGMRVVSPTEAPEGLIAGSFEPGDYAVYHYRGDYRYMKDAHMRLEKWIADKGHKEKKSGLDAPCSAGRTEFYITDPAEVEDPEEWVTEIAFLLESPKLAKDRL